MLLEGGQGSDKSVNDFIRRLVMIAKRGINLMMAVALIIVFSIGGCAMTSNGNTSRSGVTSSPAVNGYPHGDLLVSIRWLQQNLGSKELVVIDTRTSGYEVSHIPGAVNLVRDRFKEGSKTGSVKDLEDLFTSVGLRRDMKFVIYDDPSQSFGTAGWFFWLLEYLGCTDVHVLDGGWPKWLADGAAKQTEIVDRAQTGKLSQS